jgi:hypothetical protein
MELRPTAVATQHSVLDRVVFILVKLIHSIVDTVSSTHAHGRSILVPIQHAVAHVRIGTEGVIVVFIWIEEENIPFISRRIVLEVRVLRGFAIDTVIMKVKATVERRPFASITIVIDVLEKGPLSR